MAGTLFWAEPRPRNAPVTVQPWQREQRGPRPLVGPSGADRTDPWRSSHLQWVHVPPPTPQPLTNKKLMINAAARKTANGHFGDKKAPRQAEKRLEEGNIRPPATPRTQNAEPCLPPSTTCPMDPRIPHSCPLPFIRRCGRLGQKQRSAPTQRPSFCVN